MTESTATASPLDQIDIDFLQPLVKNLFAGIRAPTGLDEAAHATHDQAIITLLEDLNPRTPVEATVASIFVSAHCGAMANARAALRFPEGSRECARVTSLGASLGRLALQAVRMLWQRQGTQGPRGANINPMQSGDPRQAGGSAAPERQHPMSSGDQQRGGDVNTSQAAPERQHPMSSGDAQPAATGDDVLRRFDPMQSGDPQPADAIPAGHAAPERQHPMSSGDTQLAGADENARGRQDPMPSEPDPKHDPDDKEARLSWRTASPDDPSGTHQTANARQHPMSSGEPECPPREYTRSGKLIPQSTLYRPDGTPWDEPPACWQGPSWLAHRFPLDPAERLSLWNIKARDELTPEMRRAAYGYVHEPGVLEAHEARMAAEAAAETAMRDR